MRSLVTLLFIFAFTAVFSQQTDGSSYPKLLPQSGFGADVQTYFSFSTQNNYLYGYNIMGELVIYDLRSSRQIKKIIGSSPATSTLIYLPKPQFSKDETLVLLPNYPDGTISLFHLVENKELCLLKPKVESEKYTHALFSADNKKILVISQTNGDSPDLRVSIFSTDGTLIKEVLLQTPPSIAAETPFAVKLLMGKQLKELKRIARVMAVAANEDLSVVYLGFEGQDLYSLNLTDKGQPQRYSVSALKRFKISDHNVSYLEMKARGMDTLVVKVRGGYSDEGNGYLQRNDTLLVVNVNSRRVLKKVPSAILSVPELQRSNAIWTDLQTSNDALNVYFKTKKETDYGVNNSCYDLFTDKLLFSYSKGKVFHYYTKGDFSGGILNGGYIMAVSDNQKLMVENTRNILVHNVEKGHIQNSFNAIRGSYRISQPIYIDSFRLLIPKVTKDAFVLDLKNGKTKRLHREADCMDTARAGANVYFRIDETAPAGLENGTLSHDKKLLATVNYMPQDLCGTPGGKIISVFRASDLQPVGQYSFIDREFSYRLHFVPASYPKFLVNYKLVSFRGNAEPTIKELVIKQKKHSYYAASPVYLPKSNTIFAVLGTRNEPGDANLIFAHFDPDGNLLKSVVYNRPKTKYKFQTFIFESKLSPDSSKLLFCLHDGFAGIFDLNSMKVTHTFEHGASVNSPATNTYDHTTILSGCFVGNDRFVTAGNDGKVRLWSISGNKEIRVVNPEEPMWYFGVTVSLDLKYLVALDVEKAVRFIDMETGQWKSKFFAYDFESTALVSDEGYYIADKKALPSMHFLHRGRSYDFSQFDLSLNRPDLLLKRMGVGDENTISLYQTAYERRLNKLNLSGMDIPKFDIRYKGPVLTIDSLPNEISATSSASLKMKITASDDDFPVKAIRVLVNGVPIYGVSGWKFTGKPANKHTTLLNIPLQHGFNILSVSVVNSMGVESLSENLKIQRTGKPVKPTLHLVAVGANQYKDKLYNLDYPAKDAADVVSLFESSNVFASVNKIVLSGEKVTKANLIKIKEKLRMAKPEDFVVLFYAGHGVLDEKLKYFLSTFEMDFAKPALKGIPYDELEGLLDSIPPLNKILLLDACHSGELDKEDVNGMGKGIPGEVQFTSKKRGTGPEISINETADLVRAMFSDLRVSSGAAVIAAAGATQFAYEGEKWQNGAFTSALKKGLTEKAADIDRNGVINISELLEYVQDEVFKRTNGRQVPCSRKENIMNDMVIW